ncbi:MULTISPECIES: glutamine--fructose-6-phosphate transaminase (isomerizing) [Faecalibacterium]|jgi:glutamine---fructose-6-phosphate transaminase (isomerizing)|uniref:glutamine--fructose-6-phosphate transaminase (isomerizing) n=1 Tax=Faecalibacterium TaxID=216851 RepID=UPI000E52A28B|nr:MULTISPECIES: glutamine--fructose-6-phosphate transaminase (isomerizing) [Faecalibacterium]RHQ30093.1 glutamine--fructose-6-phosphate transaminase (isomerizing) [Faecalibacterium sp. AF28-13AC]
MCGIVGYVGKRNAQNVLLDGLEKLEYRGYDSTGVALALDGGIRVVKSKGRLAELRKKLELQALAESGCGIGHTRWATHGEPSDVNSHPHSTPRVSIVHNGIIENYGILKERLIAKGYTFESETDTEVLVKLIDSCYEGEPLQAIHEALSMVRGSYALAVLFRDFPDTVFAVKRESPLIVGWGEGENFVASDIPALLKYTRRYSVLEEGDLAVVTRECIRFYNEFAEPVEREILTADWDMEAAEKGGYPHFMLKEINEQPAAITATVSPRVEDGLPDLRIPELSDEKLRDIGTIHLVACGTAMHAGMVGKAAIETLARVPAEVDIASEFRYRDPILNKNDLVIIISQSGETSDTLAALKLAKSRGVPVLAIVNVVGSSIARAADYVLYTYAGPEIAVASTKAYMVQMCVLYLFALRLAYARGAQTEAETRRLTAELLRASEVIKPRLADCEQIKYLASRFVNTQSCFFIGRGFDYSLSLEGSLKLKEISYVHSDAYAAGELKHGTISLITDGVPVIALATQKKVYEKTISNAKETKSRGAKVLLFTTKDAVVPDGVADYVVRLDDYDDLLMPLQLIVPLQLFAYYMAVLRGCDVDKPRNLAKSVTVE